MNNSTKYSHKHLSDYPTNESGSTIFLQLTCKEEIPNTISSLNSNKASGSTLRLKFWYKILQVLLLIQTGKIELRCHNAMSSGNSSDSY